MENLSVYDALVGIKPYEIGKKLSEIRREKGLTQAEFAETVGVSTKAVSNWERGIKKLQQSHLMIAAVVLGVTTDDILCLKK